MAAAPPGRREVKVAPYRLEGKFLPFREVKNYVEIFIQPRHAGAPVPSVFTAPCPANNPQPDLIETYGYNLPPLRPGGIIVSNITFGKLGGSGLLRDPIFSLM